MSHIANKIIAKDKALYNVFSETRYRIDSFQREYRWQHKQIEALISDLTSSFMANYEESHTMSDVDNYDCYYMGPIVLCEDGSEVSVVDGQQRLTSFTLLLIYLRHLQKKTNLQSIEYRELNNYIYVQKGGKRTFSLDVPSRENILKRLYSMPTETIDFDVSVKDSADRDSLENLLQCYDDISHIFPKSIASHKVLPLFIDWLVTKVVLVEIRAFSVDNAYSIFETMNNRGLSLNPTEILKAFVLSKILDVHRNEEMNELWKRKISEMKFTAGDDADLTFFRAWFRSKYAQTISQGQAGNAKMDFEQIGAQFQTWFKNNHKLMHVSTADDYYYFVKGDFDFFSTLYCKILKEQDDEGYGDTNELYVTSKYPMADSLFFPLIFAPIMAIDSKETTERKILIMNRFADIFINRRMLMEKSVNQSTIRRGIFELIKKIRNANIDQLLKTLNEELLKFVSESRCVLLEFGFAQNYMHYVLARIRYALSNESFSSFLRSRKQSSYVLTRIFSEEEIENINSQENLNVSVRSIYNYCLCRRQESYMLPENVNERISYLKEQGCFPELDVNETINVNRILNMRINKINEILENNIWPLIIRL